MLFPAFHSQVSSGDFGRHIPQVDDWGNKNIGHPGSSCFSKYMHKHNSQSKVTPRDMNKLNKSRKIRLMRLGMISSHS